MYIITIFIFVKLPHAKIQTFLVIDLRNIVYPKLYSSYTKFHFIYPSPFFF